MTQQQWGQAPTQPLPQPPQWGQQPPPPPGKKRSTGQKTLLWIAGIVIALWAIGALIGGNDTSTDSVTTNAPQGDKVSQGLGAQDASADVRIVSFKAGEFGESKVVLEITNHSDGTSDYYIEVAFEDAAGTNVGWGNAIAQHVEPGQKARVTASTFEESAERVKITQIQRTASS